jgi:hypothetical protein
MTKEQEALIKKAHRSLGAAKPLLSNDMPDTDSNSNTGENHLL